ncbi:uncharacterized protein LOC133340310 isoform X1 [Lethenteron reissneri]|uniref:uncharacterized protein LOC133340310 isoform X1 n=1 Tax=Lethenteron reissneri TaxID=7753 RepID=UPI002AB7A896|nr:uncharacterized protein LOC133340310 isoform X1 [Lethenteron reissneri]
MSTKCKVNLIAKFNLSKKKPDPHVKRLDVNKIVINQSNIPISDSLKSVLAKVLNFAVTPKHIPVDDIIAQVDVALKGLGHNPADVARSEIAAILKNAKKPISNISKDERFELSKLKNRDDIVILSADKGNATVIMDETTYNNKIQDLCNYGSYTKINRDPTNCLATKNNNIITKSTSLIDQIKQSSLKSSTARPPRFYGLPKIHQIGTPLRPIVSTINSPTYKLARFLSETLLPFTGKSTSAVLNSAHLVSLIKDISLSPDDLLVSFDVVSLFTNVPVLDTIAIIEDLVQQGLNPDVPTLVRLCLTNTYFTWNGTFYKQNDGTPMGYPLSPVVANVFMEKFETDAIQTSTLLPSLWTRYVDDTFVIWPHGLPALNQFLNHINSIHPSIKFTMEVEKDGKLPFPYVLIEKRP